MTAKKRPAPKSSRKSKNTEDLWIAPKSNLKGENGDRAWDERGGMPRGSRLLELADIALGFKKPELPKKRRAAAGGNGFSKS